MSSGDSHDPEIRIVLQGGSPAPSGWVDRPAKWHSRGPSKRARRRQQEPVGPFPSADEFSAAFADELARALGSREPSATTSDETGIRIVVNRNTVFMPRSEVQAMWDDILFQHEDGSRGTTTGNWSDSVLGITTEIELEWEGGITDVVYDDS